MSFYLDEIITIVDRDWEQLKSYFVIPEDMRRIDSEKIKVGMGVVPTIPQNPQLILDIKEESCDCY